MEYYSAVKNEILSFATRWMERGNVMLGKINLSEKDKYHDFTNTWKRNKTKGEKGDSDRLSTRKQTEGFHSGVGDG